MVPVAVCVVSLTALMFIRIPELPEHVFAGKLRGSLEWRTMTGSGALTAGPIAAVRFDVDGALYSQSRLRRRLLPRLLDSACVDPLSGFRAARVLREYRRTLERLRMEDRPLGYRVAALSDGGAGGEGGS